MSTQDLRAKNKHFNKALTHLNDVTKSTTWHRWKSFLQERNLKKSLHLKLIVAIILTICIPKTTQAKQLSLEQSVDLIARYLTAWGDEISSGGGPRTPQIVFGIAGTNIYGSCKGQDNQLKIPGSFYCGYTNTIILEVNQLETLRRRHGDGAVVYAVAHEYGHWIQSTRKTKRVFPDFELQADCLAGALIAGASKEIGLETEDIPEMLNTAFAIGGGSHGTPSQRAWSLKKGLKSGSLNYCFSEQTNKGKSNKSSAAPKVKNTSQLPLPPPPKTRTVPRVRRQDVKPKQPVRIGEEINWIRPYSGNSKEKAWDGTTLSKSIASISHSEGEILLNVKDIEAIEDGFKATYLLWNTRTIKRSPDFVQEISCSNFKTNYGFKKPPSSNWESLLATSAYYSLCPTAKIPSSINVDQSFYQSKGSKLPRNYESSRLANVRKYDCKNQKCLGTKRLGLIYSRGKSYVIEASDIEKAEKTVGWRFNNGYNFLVTIKDQDTENTILSSKARIACYEKNVWGDGLVSGYWPFSVRTKDNEFWGELARSSLCN